MKFSTSDYETLLSSYNIFFKTDAGEDLIEFLDKEKNKALAKLKIEDCPIARAKWQMVDNFYARLEFLRKEVHQKQKEKQNKM